MKSLYVDDLSSGGTDDKDTIELYENAKKILADGDMATEIKVWVLLFTCATTRAVHFEMVSDMTTEEFLLAFQRFTGRRGTPSYVRSDNAKSFKEASKKLFSILDFERVKEMFGRERIVWEFNLEKAPW